MVSFDDRRLREEREGWHREREFYGQRIKERTKEGRMNLYTVKGACPEKHGPEQGLDLRGVAHVVRDVE